MLGLPLQYVALTVKLQWPCDVANESMLGLVMVVVVVSFLVLVASFQVVLVVENFVAYWLSWDSGGDVGPVDETDS